LSGIDEQRCDNIPPIDFIDDTNWYCLDEEMAYYNLHNENGSLLGHIFRPSLIYEEKSEEYLIKFFNGAHWNDVVSITCPMCGVVVWVKRSDDWLLFTEYVMHAERQNLVKYGSGYHVGNR